MGKSPTECSLRLRCFYCGTSVSNEVPEDTVVRAVLICPECLEKEAKELPEEDKSTIVQYLDMIKRVQK